MARSLNKVMLIGRLGRDPEMKFTQSEKAVTTFTLATNRYNTTTKQEETDWHTVVCWERVAETVNEHLRKGSRVYVEGRLQTRSWEGKDGQKQQRTEIVASDVIMLDGKPDSDAERPAARFAAVASDPATDDLPF